MTSQRWFAILFFALALAATLAHMARELDVEGEQSLGGAALSDFRDAFYYPGVALLDGRNPYAPIDYLDHYPVGSAYPLYSPVSLAAHLPLSLLPYRVAQVVFIAANVAFLLLLAALSLRLAGVRPTLNSILVIGAVLILSRPGHQNLFLGQCTFYVVGGAYLALLQARTRPWLAGAGLAVAALKPTIGVPLAFLMLCRRDARAVGAGVAISAVIAGVMLFPLLHVAGGIEGLTAAVRANYAEFRSNPYVDSLTSPYRVDLIALTGRAAGRSLTLIENAILSAAILGASGWVIRGQLQQCGREVLATSLICVALLVCTYHLPYDAMLLAAPAVALVANPGALGVIGRKPIWRWSALGLITVPAVSYFATQRGLEALASTDTAWWVATSAASAAGGLLFAMWLLAAVVGGERVGNAREAARAISETGSRSCA